jgi:hypothetical protein
MSKSKTRTEQRRKARRVERYEDAPRGKMMGRLARSSDVPQSGRPSQQGWDIASDDGQEK